MTKIKVGSWRHGPMQVVSGRYGRERIHYQAPGADKLNHEMHVFLKWFDQEITTEPILKAALAHLWFITIHPFDDGNGRIARVIADMALAQSEKNEHRFYSMSSQIKAERNEYYKILELTQKGPLDVTPWMEWFLGCLARAIQGAELTLNSVLYKAHTLEILSSLTLNKRQRKVINLLLEGFEGKLTTSKWAKISHCSQDTAHRDILDLVNKEILFVNPGKGRSTSYSLITI